MTERARAREPRECAFPGKHHVKLRMEILGRAIVFNMTGALPSCEVKNPHVTILFHTQGFLPKDLERVNTICRTFVYNRYRKDLSQDEFTMTLHPSKSSCRHVYVGGQVLEIVEKLRQEFQAWTSPSWESPVHIRISDVQLKPHACMHKVNRNQKSAEAAAMSRSNVLSHAGAVQTHVPQNLVALIAGLPGSGKSALSRIASSLGFVTADLDDFSQHLINNKTYSSCQHFTTDMIDVIKHRINRFLLKHQDSPVVLCGLSTFVYDHSCVRHIADCTGDCKAIWIDIIPDVFHPPRGYTKHIPELLESTRRAVLREFQPKQVRRWRSWSHTRRADEGSFWKLSPPGTYGPKNIPRTGLTPQKCDQLLRLPLHTFITTYPLYFDTMYQDLVDDGYSESRAIALKRGFVPMRMPHVLELLKDTLDKHPRPYPNPHRH